MPTVGSTVLTLEDWAKRLDPDGKTPDIAELLAQTNGILDDMLWKMGNLPTGERVTVRTGLPVPVWRLLNQGVVPTKSTTAQIDEQTGMLEAWSEVDVDLAMLNGNTPAFRLSEAQAHLEGMNQEMAQTLFFGNASLAQEEFTGFATRYSSLTADIGQNILDAGGTGSDNSSVWLVVWGPQTVYGIFPKESMAGLDHKNLGQETVETVAGVGGARMLAFRDRFQWKAGLAVKDWRFAVRIANIDISDLVAGTGADLVEEMIQALHRIPNMYMGRPSFYMNRTCFQFLDIQRRNDVISGGGLKFENVDGRVIGFFRGIPIRKVDQLTEAEAQVT